MPTYILMSTLLMSTLTPDGRQTLHKDPDRLEQVNKEIADFGCKVVAQYAVLVQCNFVTTSRLPTTKRWPTSQLTLAREEPSTSSACPQSRLATCVPN
jgi:uncharacterized protein with GYD domain